MNIKEKDWSLYAEMIRSEQIPAEDLRIIFEENPEFSAWYYECYTTPR